MVAHRDGRISGLAWLRAPLSGRRPSVWFQRGRDRMIRPIVTIELDQTLCEPGELLTGHYVVDPQSIPLATLVEVSVYWNTEGKGNEDRAVQYRKRGSTDDGPLFDERGTGPFAVRLPSAPLSYDGVLVKIVWCVQVGVTFAGGAQSETVVPFRVGHVGPVAEVVNV